MWKDTFQIESVEYRATPQTRLSQAEQSMPFLVELPPHSYGMFNSDMAREIICPRVARDGSTTTGSSTTAGAGGGGVGAMASGPFAFVGSAVSVASEDRSGARTAGHSSSSAKKRT